MRTEHALALTAVLLTTTLTLQHWSRPQLIQVHAINMAGPAGALRRGHLARTFGDAAFPYVAWPAVSPPAAYTAAWAKDTRKRRQRHRYFNGRVMQTPSSLALTLSHQSIYQHLLSNLTAAWIVVAEDDVVVKSNFGALLEAALGQADPKKHDVVRLASRAPSGLCDPAELTVAPETTPQPGAFLYAVSRKGAALLTSKMPNRKCAGQDGRSCTDKGMSPEGYFGADALISSSYVNRATVSCWLGHHDDAPTIVAGGRHALDA